MITCFGIVFFFANSCNCFLFFFQVQVILGNSLTVGPIQYFVGTSLADNSSSGVIGQEDLVSTGITGLALNTSHSLYIITQGVVKDSVELNHVIPVNVHLAYFDGNRSGNASYL